MVCNEMKRAGIKGQDTHVLWLEAFLQVPHILLCQLHVVLEYLSDLRVTHALE